MTVRELADMKNVPYTTAATWLQQGKVPGAQKVDYPRGAIWEIPIEAAKAFQPPTSGRGRPKGAKNKPKGKARRKRA